MSLKCVMKDYFYKPIKEDEKEHNVLFWGCVHLNHLSEHWTVPIWKHRGYDSIEEYNLGLVNNWNSKANDKTIGFLLGDSIFGHNAEEKFIKFLKDISFKKLYVMPGNHLGGYKQIFDSIEENVYYPEENKEVIFVPNYLEAVIGGQEIVMSHYPLASWNHQGKGSFMIHSHCHANLYKSEVGKILYKAKIIDVGVENCPYPISLAEVKKKFRDIENVSFDHHTSLI